jgi:hypothetical protein
VLRFAAVNVTGYTAVTVLHEVCGDTHLIKAKVKFTLEDVMKAS